MIDTIKPLAENDPALADAIEALLKYIDNPFYMLQPMQRETLLKFIVGLPVKLYNDYEDQLINEIIAGEVDPFSKVDLHDCTSVAKVLRAMDLYEIVKTVSKRAKNRKKRR